MMRYFLLALLPFLLVSWRDLNERIPQINRELSSYEMRKKSRVDHFDFSGEFEKLDKIDIDGRKLKEVKMNLSGNYPILESIIYESSFGQLDIYLTGKFTTLRDVNFICGSTAVNLDASGVFEKSCILTVCSKEDIHIRLPENVSVLVNTKTVTGKVKTSTLKKKGWGILNRTYINSHYNENELPHLTLNIETTSGTIFIN